MTGPSKKERTDHPGYIRALNNTFKKTLPYLLKILPSENLPSQDPGNENIKFLHFFPANPWECLFATVTFFIREGKSLGRPLFISEKVVHALDFYQLKLRKKLEKQPSAQNQFELW